MHILQRSILQKLTTKPSLRFSDLKPTSVESNKFMYHLQKLADEGLVKKGSGVYQLTAAGRRFVDRVSFESFQERIQPKIVTLIACIDDRGRYLVYRRGKQPFYDMIGFPYGKIHLGERIAEAASRELKEKTGLSAALVHRGDVYMTVRDGQNLITHMLCHIFAGQDPKGTLIARSSMGECFWKNPRDIPTKECMPGFQNIVDLLRKEKRLFFKEYFLDNHEE